MLQAVGQRFEKIAAAEGVNGLGDARLFGDDLLCAQCNRGGVFARKRPRFIQRIGMERLGATQRSGQRLHGYACHIVHRLLRGERHARRLGVKAHQPRARIFCAKSFAHFARPDAARGPIFCQLLEKVVVGVEKEREARGEIVNVQPARDAPAHIFEAIRERERQFLRGGRTRFTNVVARNGNRVPFGQLVACQTRWCPSRAA